MAFARVAAFHCFLGIRAVTPHWVSVQQNVAVMLLQFWMIHMRGQAGRQHNFFFSPLDSSANEKCHPQLQLGQAWRGTYLKSHDYLFYWCNVFGGIHAKKGEGKGILLKGRVVKKMETPEQGSLVAGSMSLTHTYKNIWQNCMCISLFVYHIVVFWVEMCE